MVNTCKIVNNVCIPTFVFFRIFPNNLFCIYRQVSQSTELTGTDGTTLFIFEKSLKKFYVLYVSIFCFL